MNRLCSLCRAVLSWLGLVPDTQDRPGDDGQWSEWPRVRAAEANLETQQDNDERRWEP